MALLSVAVTSEDSVNSNLATVILASEASGHYIDDAIICNLRTVGRTTCISLRPPRF